MRILYLSQYFPPEMGAPAARVSELSREWARLGHRVTVLTGFPNHPTGVVHAGYRGELWRREEKEGVQIVRTPIFAAANRGVIKRSLAYLSYAASSALVGPLLAEKPEVIIATSPQFLTALSGLWLSKLLRAPFVFEVRDLWPRSIVEVGALPKRHPAIRGLEQLEKMLYRQADRIVVVTDSFVDEIAAHGIDRKKIAVITNGVDLELFKPADRAQARAQLGLPQDDLIASYVGTHGMAHGLGMLIETAKQLRARGGKAAQAKILLLGEGAEKAKLVEAARAEHLDNLIFWDQRPRDQVALAMAASDACLVLLKDAPLFRTVIPSKIFECMGAGRAIVSTVDGESRRILEAAGCGLFSPPENSGALADLLAKLAEDPSRLDALGASGHAHAVAHYSRPALARRYLDEVLAPLVARGR
jgi:colanic acid biosynthesis glycosyl transferase WcaI